MKAKQFIVTCIVGAVGNRRTGQRRDGMIRRSVLSRLSVCVLMLHTPFSVLVFTKLLLVLPLYID